MPARVLILTWKSATLHRNTLLCFCTCSVLCTCTSIKNNHNIIKAAWTILIILIITQCVVSLSILFIDSYLKKKKVVNNKLEMNSCLFSFFRTKSAMTKQWLTSTRHSLIQHLAETVTPLIIPWFQCWSHYITSVNQKPSALLFYKQQNFFNFTWNTSIDLHLRH